MLAVMEDILACWLVCLYFCSATQLETDFLDIAILMGFNTYYIIHFAGVSSSCEDCHDL